MQDKLQKTVVSALETIVDKLEQDENVAKRPRVFAQDEAVVDGEPKSDSDKKPKSGRKSKGDNQENGEEPVEFAENDIEKFKKLSFEILDIGLFYGNKGLDKVKSLPLYQKIDSVVNFDDKFAIVKGQGEQLYTLIDSKFRPIVQKVFFMYDEATNKVVSFMKILQDKQQQVHDYVNKTYQKVNVTVQGSWMRLDIDNDGQVSVDDLKNSLSNLYKFLKDFDLVEATTEIKGKLYQDAINYMQKELEESKKQKQKGDSPQNQGEKVPMSNAVEVDQDKLD